MKRKGIILLIILTFIGVIQFGRIKKMYAGMDVHIGIGIPLPTVVISSPPAVVMIPNTPVYYAPDCGIEIFFYSGCWYQRHNGHWFRATYYNGPWVYMPHPQVPAVFMQLPPNYYEIPVKQARIPYGQFKKNWKKWDKQQPRHRKVHNRQ